MLVLCPEMASLYDVAEFLFNDNPPTPTEQVLLNRVHLELALFHLRRTRLEAARPHTSGSELAPILAPCKDHVPTFDDTPGGACDLVHLLHEWSPLYSAITRRHEISIVSFIANHVLRDSPLTLKELWNSFESSGVAQYTLGPDQGIDPGQQEYVIDAYAFFFDYIMVDEQSGAFAPLRNLSEFQFQYVSMNWNDGNAGTHLKFLLKNAKWSLSGFPAQTFWSDLIRPKMAEYLGEFQERDFMEILVWLDSFAYSDGWFTESLRSSTWTDSSLFSKDDCLDLVRSDLLTPADRANICEGQLPSDHDCYPHCQAVKRLEPHMDKIVRLFEASVEQDVNGVLDRLPTCKYGKGNITRQCWEKVMTERGVCFTSREGDSSCPLSNVQGISKRQFLHSPTVIMDQIGPKHSIEYVYDLEPLQYDIKM